MDSRLERALESSITRIRSGDSIEQCVADYPELSPDFEPLLRITLEPSGAFRAASKERVLSRLSQRPEGTATPTPAYRPSLGERLQHLKLRLAAGGWSARRALVPAGALVGVFIGVALLLQPWSPSTEKMVGCTVNSTSGSVEVLLSGQSDWAPAMIDMDLNPGERIRTGPSGKALLTFFEGSIVDVLPDTELEMQDLNAAQEGQTAIAFKQFTGKTWNRVMALIDPESSYEVQTPSAYCLVRGTYFFVSVGEDKTEVKVDEGTVVVRAKGQEVSVQAGEQATVLSDQAPAKSSGKGEDEDDDEEPTPQPRQEEEEVPPAQPPAEEGTSTSWIHTDDDDDGDSTTRYYLTLNSTEGGSVTTPWECTRRHERGTVVSVEATPDAGHAFKEWTGDLSGTDNPQTLTMDGDKTVTATFLEEFTLTVNTVGTGSVTKNPDQTTFLDGDTVDLTAVPGAGWQFTGWSGDLSGTDNPQTLTMDGDKTVTATFTKDKYTLTVITVGDGSVTKDPFQATYHYGATVDLTANADAGWTFSGWSGDLLGSTNPETLTVDETPTVTATFAFAPAYVYTLKVKTQNGGSVHVESVSGPHDILAGQELIIDCTESEDVHVVALPDLIHDFNEWAWNGADELLLGKEVANNFISMDDNYELEAKFD